VHQKYTQKGQNSDYFDEQAKRGDEWMDYCGISMHITPTMGLLGTTLLRN
jgi:hypothetical protein